MSSPASATDGLPVIEIEAGGSGTREGDGGLPPLPTGMVADPEKERIASKIFDIIKTYLRVVLECLPASGKTTVAARLAHLLVADGWPADNKSLTTNRVLYISATHFAVKEFINVLRKFGEKIQAVVLHVQGKTHLCPLLAKGGTSKTWPRSCTSCSQYKNLAGDDTPHKLPHGVYGKEELIRMGAESGMCPYLLQWKLLDAAGIVATVYDYAFVHERRREFSQGWGMVILDEVDVILDKVSSEPRVHLPIARTVDRRMGWSRDLCRPKEDCRQCMLATSRSESIPLFSGEQLAGLLRDTWGFCKDRKTQRLYIETGEPEHRAHVDVVKQTCAAIEENVRTFADAFASVPELTGVPYDDVHLLAEKLRDLPVNPLPMQVRTVRMKVSHVDRVDAKAARMLDDFVRFWRAAVHGYDVVACTKDISTGHGKLACSLSLVAFDEQKARDALSLLFGAPIVLGLTGSPVREDKFRRAACFDLLPNKGEGITFSSLPFEIGDEFRVFLVKGRYSSGRIRHDRRLVGELIAGYLERRKGDPQRGEVLVVCSSKSAAKMVYYTLKAMTTARIKLHKAKDEYESTKREDEPHEVLITYIRSDLTRGANLPEYELCIMLGNGWKNLNDFLYRAQGAKDEGERDNLFETYVQYEADRAISQAIMRIPRDHERCRAAVILGDFEEDDLPRSLGTNLEVRRPRDLKDILLKEVPALCATPCTDDARGKRVQWLLGKNGDEREGERGGGPDHQVATSMCNTLLVAGRLIPSDARVALKVDKRRIDRVVDELTRCGVVVAKREGKKKVLELTDDGGAILERVVGGR